MMLITVTPANERDAFPKRKQSFTDCFSLALLACQDIKSEITLVDDGHGHIQA